MGKKVNSESIEEKKEKIVESDANKSDLSEFTEQRMFDDMNELKRIGKIDATKCTKKKLRQMLEQKYNLKKRALKEHKEFVIACDRFCKQCNDGLQRIWRKELNQSTKSKIKRLTLKLKQWMNQRK